VINKLLFEHTSETLHGSIIITVPFPTHGGSDGILAPLGSRPPG
jgi:hypothetical protein